LTAWAADDGNAISQLKMALRSSTENRCGCSIAVTVGELAPIRCAELVPFSEA
jgi:hypothetical protein